jgi:hypothetical protein
MLAALFLASDASHQAAANDPRARDVVGTGFLDENAVLHIQLEDGRDGNRIYLRVADTIDG